MIKNQLTPLQMGTVGFMLGLMLGLSVAFWLNLTEPHAEEVKLETGANQSAVYLARERAAELEEAEDDKFHQSFYRMIRHCQLISSESERQAPWNRDPTLPCQVVLNKLND